MEREVKTWDAGFDPAQADRRCVAGGRIGMQSLAARLTLLIVIAAIGASAGAQGAGAAGCPNETSRAAQSARYLPNCRAFELVSPPEGEPYNTDNLHNTVGARASSAGGAIAWFSFYPLSSSFGGEFHDISTRGLAGWNTETIGPRLSPTNNGFYYCEPMLFFSADLSEGIFTDGSHSPGSGQPAPGECPGNDPALVANEPEGFQNVFIRSRATGGYALVNVTPETATPSDAWFQDASDDFSHVVFEDSAKLTERAPVGASLYEWVSGAVNLVTVLPNGTQTAGVIPGAVVELTNRFGTSQITHPVSVDGTRVIFEAEGKLFLRENGEQLSESAPGLESECADACTIQLDASLGGGGSFLAANTSGKRIFFTDGSGATQRLYEYDTKTAVLSDLTPSGSFGLLGLSGISDDGSYLYVVAQSALVGNAAAGQPNLYVFHNGVAEFVATLGGNDEVDSRDWDPSQLTARISPNGRYLGFESIEKLTGYENAPAQSEDCLVEREINTSFGPCSEIFLYDAVQHELHCVSCTPGGAQPTAVAELTRAEQANPGPGPTYMQRNVLDDGRVFFDTADPLLPGVTNGASNVYEYEDGHLSVISSGVSSADSFFYDASPSGEDAFFITTQHLVRGDTDNGMRLYDARVDGGFAEPEGSVQCSGDGCRSSGGGGVFVPPPVLTSSLQGSGNLLPSKPTVKILTRRQKLARALHACQRKKRPRKRAACKRQARLRYGAHSTGAKRGGGK